MEDLIRFINTNFGEHTRFMLKAYEDGEWDASDGGNFDDTLGDGIDIGYGMAMRDVLEFLGEYK